VLGAADLVKDMVAKRGVMAAASPRAALAIETPKPRRRPAGVPASSSDCPPAAAKGSSGDAGSGDSVGDKLFRALKLGIPQKVLDDCKAAKVGSEADLLFNVHGSKEDPTKVTQEDVLNVFLPLKECIKECPADGAASVAQIREALTMLDEDCGGKLSKRQKMTARRTWLKTEVEKLHSRWALMVVAKSRAPRRSLNENIQQLKDLMEDRPRILSKTRYIGKQKSKQLANVELAAALGSIKEQLLRTKKLDSAADAKEVARCSLALRPTACNISVWGYFEWMKRSANLLDLSTCFMDTQSIT